MRGLLYASCAAICMIGWAAMRESAGSWAFILTLPAGVLTHLALDEWRP